VYIKQRLVMDDAEAPPANQNYAAGAGEKIAVIEKSCKDQDHLRALPPSLTPPLLILLDLLP
jgi:hypothetical protein